MRYVAWIYDNPYVLLYSYTIIYPGNYVFVFDKEFSTSLSQTTNIRRGPFDIYI